MPKKAPAPWQPEWDRVGLVIGPIPLQARPGQISVLQRSAWWGCFSFFHFPHASARRGNIKSQSTLPCGSRKIPTYLVKIKTLKVAGLPEPKLPHAYTDDTSTPHPHLHLRMCPTYIWNMAPQYSGPISGVASSRQGLVLFGSRDQLTSYFRCRLTGPWYADRCRYQTHAPGRDQICMDKSFELLSCPSRRCGGPGFIGPEST